MRSARRRGPADLLLKIGSSLLDLRHPILHGSKLIMVASEVVPLADFDKSTRENRVQAHDADTGMPMWVVEVMDFDPAARDRMFKVKIAAEHQPVPPEAVAGTPVRPVVLDGLLVMPYLNDNGPRRRSPIRCGRRVCRLRRRRVGVRRPVRPARIRELVIMMTTEPCSR